MERLLILKKKMINCSKTMNYFIEKSRMTKQKGVVCEIECTDCPFSSFNNGKECLVQIMNHTIPKKQLRLYRSGRINIRRKTYLSELLKNYPNTPLDYDGTPNFCPYRLGLSKMDDCRKDHNCVKCWNQPLKDGEE